MASGKNPDRSYDQYRDFEWDVGSATMTGELHEPHPIVPIVLETLKKHAKEKNKQKTGKQGIADTLRNLTLKQQILHFLKDGAGNQDSEDEDSLENKPPEMDEAQLKAFLQSVKEFAVGVWGSISPRRPHTNDLDSDPRTGRANKTDRNAKGGFFSIASHALQPSNKNITAPNSGLNSPSKNPNLNSPGTKSAHKLAALGLSAVKLNTAAHDISTQIQVISAFGPKRTMSSPLDIGSPGSTATPGQKKSTIIGQVLISLTKAARAPVDSVKQKILCINYDAWRTRYMISPDNPFYIVWNATVSVITTIIGISISYKMAFSLTEPNFPEGTIPYLIAGYCIIMTDLLVEFNLKFYEKGHIIACRKLAFMNAMKHGIYWKLIPFAGFFFRAGMSFQVPQNMIVLQGLLDLLFVYRIVTLFSSLDKYSILFKLSRTQMGLIYLISLLANLIFMLHYSTCVWLFLLSLTNETQRLRYLDYFNDGSMPNQYDIYFANLYWFLTIVSTVGFGEFFPLNFIERIYISAIMIFSALFFGYLVNAIGKFMMENQQMEISIKIKLATINSELKDKNVSKSVSILVLRYLEYALRKDNSGSDTKNSEILDSIHPDLKFDILKEIYVKIFREIKGFHEFSETVLAKFAQSAREWSSPPGSILIDETKPDRENNLYYIASGSVIVFLKDSDCYLKELGPTQVFGEFGFFTGCKRFSSVISKDYVTLVKFSRLELDKCLDALAYERLIRLKYQVNMYSDFSFFDIICYSCRGRNHTARNCKYTHYEMNKRTLVAMKRAEVDDRKICIRRNRRPFFAVICNKEIRSAILKLQAEQVRNRMNSYSVIDMSENELEVVQNHKQIESKNAKQKRRTHRGRSNAPQQIRKKSTDKVAIGGFNLFYENFNIDKVCQKYSRKEGKPLTVGQTQTIKPTIEVKRAVTGTKDVNNVLGGAPTSPFKPRKSIYVKPTLI